MKRGLWLVALSVTIVAVIVAAWARWPRPRNNVVLITIDTLRPDRISAYGYTGHQTPNLDRLAAEGSLFENAFCDVTWTTSSMASVMTGRYAPAHGLRSSGQRLADGATTLAELLAARGIKTAAIVASYPLDSIYGLNQGFELYDDHFTLAIETPTQGSTEASGEGTTGPEQSDLEARIAKLDPEALATLRRRRTESQLETGAFMAEKARHDAYRPDNELSDRAIRWLQTERREPFFLWLHYFGPHEKPQPTYDYKTWVELWRKAYDPDVVEMDTQVGRVLDALDTLGLSGRTAVILHADHGQSLTEHNFFGHGINVYDPSQHIPMLMRLPGRGRAGERTRRLVRNVDIFPTILELMGVDLTVPVDGQTLSSIRDGTASGDDEMAYVETYLPASLLFGEIRDPNGNVQLGFRRLGIRTPHWKFVVNDPAPLSDVDDSPPVTQEIRERYYSEELYDLHADPSESHNVIAAHRDVARSLLQEVNRHQSSAPVSSEAFKLDDASRERLRALGYIQ